jgi:hypothetical protein
MTTSASEKVLVVPLRSNAYSLVAGPGVAALRRRLKAASLVYDHVLLEQGRLNMTVGPSGSGESKRADDPDATFQRPVQRSVKGGAKFWLNMAPSDQPGAMRTVMHSETTYQWDATFAPFAQEVPGDCDWMHWAQADLQGDAKRLASEWTRRDMESPGLKRQWPDHTVRSAIIKHVNHDLALSATNGFAVTQDPLHRRVYESRFRLESGWRPDGFVLPVVVPSVADLGWQEVADLRRHPGMAAFREVLREVEQQALAEAAGGDLEAAAHHAFERYTAGAVVAGKNGVRGLVKTHLAGLLIGGITGAVTMDWVGPVGFAGAVALGQAPAAMNDVVQFRRARSKPSWVTAYQALVAAPVVAV